MKNTSHKRNIILFILLLAIISFSFAFLNFRGTTDIRHYMPLIYSMQDDSYLINDFFIQENQGFNFRVFFSKTIIFVNTLFNNFDITFPFISSVAIFLISLNIYLLTYYYFKDKKFSILASVMTIFLIHFNLGGVSLVRPFLDSNMMAHVFILSGLNLNREIVLSNILFFTHSIFFLFSLF